MTHSFTLKEMETTSDNEIIVFLLLDKVTKLHPYSPLRTRLGMIRRKLEDNKKGDTLKVYRKYIGVDKRK